MTNKEEELVEEMKNHNLKVLGISETKKRGNGEISKEKCRSQRMGEEVERKAKNNLVRPYKRVWKKKREDLAGTRKNHER